MTTDNAEIAPDLRGAESEVMRVPRRACEVALLTGGADKPYALGLAPSLAAGGVSVDFIGSDDIDGPELHGHAQIRFLNLRGDQSTKASRARKMWRVLLYYLRLMLYALMSRPRVFHILWNNKFEFFDRTVLILYYKLLGKKIVFTAHNVNAGKRDGNDGVLNRFSLTCQYRLADHILVHTAKMKEELAAEFGIPGGKVTVIPFGINNTVPNTSISTTDARKLAGVGMNLKTMLFFGNIAPYKGLEYLIDALATVMSRDPGYRLIIAGRPKGCEDYWQEIQRTIERTGTRDRIIEKIEFVPDEQTEWYFKAADVLVLPYTHVFQSGVLFLGYSFGLPVLAADVGSLREDIVEGRTGFVFRPMNAADLAAKIQECFSSPLFRELEQRRAGIQKFANEKYSWTQAAGVTRQIYRVICDEQREHA
jgi:D-inositol-3-phosphate glycosyltransferase